jgi:hypothetical protein
MAFTSADLAAIDAAIASGAMEIRFSDGRSVQYRSIDELMRARALIAGEVASTVTSPLQVPGGVTYAEFSRD